MKDVQIVEVIINWKLQTVLPAYANLYFWIGLSCSRQHLLLLCPARPPSEAVNTSSCRHHGLLQSAISAGTTQHSMAVVRPRPILACCSALISVWFGLEGCSDPCSFEVVLVHWDTHEWIYFFVSAVANTSLVKNQYYFCLLWLCAHYICIGWYLYKRIVMIECLILETNSCLSSISICWFLSSWCTSLHTELPLITHGSKNQPLGVFSNF